MDVQFVGGGKVGLKVSDADAICHGLVLHRLSERKVEVVEVVEVV